jgi:excisionase family DNA binding protein
VTAATAELRVQHDNAHDPERSDSREARPHVTLIFEHDEQNLESLGRDRAAVITLRSMTQDAPTNDNNPMIVTLTTSELRDLIRQVIREEIGGITQPRRWLSTEQVAEELGVCARSIGTLVSRDKLPAHVIGPRLLRFLWSEVEAWLMARGKNLDQLATRTPRGRLRALE